jgi:hypothetical protein
LGMKQLRNNFVEQELVFFLRFSIILLSRSSKLL